MTGPTTKSEVDPIVVERLLAGDGTVARNATAAERRLVTARWTESGKALNALERLTGWQVHRYLGGAA